MDIVYNIVYVKGKCALRPSSGRRKAGGRRRICIIGRIPKAAGVVLLLACGLLTGCHGRDAEPGGAQVLLDGAPFEGGSVAAESADDTRVYITLDGAELIDLPFGEVHTVTVAQPDGSENVVALNGESVVMQSANCENQDCVNMGAVTRDNLELRVMGGFIICLPHRVSVEVRGG